MVDPYANFHTLFEELKRKLNSDPEFEKSAKRWTGDIAYTILPDADFPYLLRVLFSIEDGKVKDIKITESESDLIPEFEFVMPHSVFMKIALGKMNLSLMSVLRGTIKLKGSKISALRKMKMFKTITENIRRIMKEWQGKNVILLRRKEFMTPHIIMGENVREILYGIKAKRVLIISGRVITKLGMVDEIKRLLSESGARIEVFDESKPETPIEVVDEATRRAHEFRPDLIIGIGGGSTMDLAKAVFAAYERPDISLMDIDPSWELTLRRKSKLMLIPTTSGTGSESNWVSVVTFKKGDLRRKEFIVNRELIPDYAISDPHFIYNLPKRLVASTGLDALTHAFEAFISPWRNELVYAFSIRALKLLMKNLPESYKNGDKDARAKVHYAATLAGLAFGNSQLAICHGLGHALGSLFDIPHGLAVAVFLPYALDYYKNSAREALEELAEELRIDEPDVIDKLRERMVELISSVNGYTKISDFGITEEEFNSKVDKLVDLAKKDPSTYSGSRIPTDMELKTILKCAYTGRHVDI